MQDRTTPEMPKRAEEYLIVAEPPSSSGDNISLSNSSSQSQAITESAHTDMQDTGASSLDSLDHTLEDPSTFLWKFDSLLSRGGQAPEEQGVRGLNTVTRVLPIQDQFGGERRSGNTAGRTTGGGDTGEETPTGYSIFKNDRGWQISGDLLSQLPRLFSGVGDRSAPRGYDLLTNFSELLQNSEADTREVTKTQSNQLTSSSFGNNGAENGEEEEGAPVLVSFLIIM